MGTIIRDFAYNPSDPRFHGIYPASETDKLKEAAEDETIVLAADSEDDDDSDIDYSLWSWRWGYNNAKPRTDHNGMTRFWLLTGISHAKTVFPFVKGTEYEMSLEASDGILLVTVAESTSDPSAGLGNERWSSIDEMSVPNQELQVLLDPSIDVFEKEIEQFIGYNKNYGDGWSTALKVKIFGNWDKQLIKVILIDIGLIPSNYISAV
ncbi:hypothetical protein HDV03_001598 [Kappamyces sp. JEL0829]|nr:hypothetical protein HDV03_001598 [Kappamyces sp. JEL0829]